MYLKNNIQNSLKLPPEIKHLLKNDYIKTMGRKK